MTGRTLRLDPELTQIHKQAWVAANATVLGDVFIDARASVWFGAVVRGDTEAIRIGEASNVQDGAILHADPGFPCTVGEGVTIGHRAVVHGARAWQRDTPTLFYLPGLPGVCTDELAQLCEHLSEWRVVERLVMRNLHRRRRRRLAHLIRHTPRLLESL